MTAPDLTSLSPEIAALLTEYWHLGYVEGGRDADPEATNEDRADVMRRRKAARAALESALAPLVRDAARLDWLERFCFKASELGDEYWALTWCDPDGNEHNVEGVPLRDAIDAAAARTPEEADTDA